MAQEENQSSISERLDEGLCDTQKNSISLGTNSGSLDGEFMNRSEEDTNLTDKETCTVKTKSIFEDTDIVDQQAKQPKIFRYCIHSKTPSPFKKKLKRKRKSSSDPDRLVSTKTDFEKITDMMFNKFSELHVTVQLSENLNRNFEKTMEQLKEVQKSTEKANREMKESFVEFDKRLSDLEPLVKEVPAVKKSVDSFAATCGKIKDKLTKSEKTVLELEIKVTKQEDVLSLFKG